MPLSNTERQQRFRQRQRGLIPPVQQLWCRICGAGCTDAHGVLCRTCWRLHTPEGKAYNREQVRRSRARRDNP